MTSPGTPTRTTKVQTAWIGGMDSNAAPLSLPGVQYQCAFNAVNRGGKITVRPRHNLLLSIQGANPQCIHFFTPTGESLPVLVMVCNGAIYTSLWPYATINQLLGATLDPNAPQVFACVGTQSAKLDSSGTLSLINPVSAIYLCDGRSRVVKWDGVLPPVTVDPQPPSFGTPASASIIVNSNGRNWVAVGNKVYASNLYDPDTFTETLIVANGGFFAFSSPVTGMIELPDRSGMLVMEARRITLIQTSVKDRTQWGVTQGFVQPLFDGLGCSGPKACVNQFGQTWIFSPGGLISLNAAAQTYQSSRVLYADLPMKVSKDNLNADCSGVTLCAHDDYLLCSVPSGGKQNRHTWCYDQNTGSGVAAWSSIWTGTQPVDYATAVINGKLRTFFFSPQQSANGGTSLVWEAFTSEQGEASGQVVANVQTAPFTVPDLDPYAFVAAELHLVDMEGNFNVKAWMGGNAGGYLPVLNLDIVAPRGPYIASGPSAWSYQPNQGFDSWRPQKRIIRTRKVNLATDAPDGSDAISSQRQENELAPVLPIGEGRYFSLLVQLTGVGSLETIRVFQDPRLAHTDPTCLPDETSSKPLVASDYRTEVSYESA